MDDLLHEVKTQREHFEGFLPSYIRLRENVDQLRDTMHELQLTVNRQQDFIRRQEEEISELRIRSVKAGKSLYKKEQVIHDLIEWYHELKAQVNGRNSAEEGNWNTSSEGEVVPDEERDGGIGEAELEGVVEDKTDVIVREVVVEVDVADNGEPEPLNEASADISADIPMPGPGAEDLHEEKRTVADAELSSVVPDLQEEKRTVADAKLSSVVPDNLVEIAEEMPMVPHLAEAQSANRADHLKTTQTRSDMPPPPTPTVTLQPPTPQTSQEDENSTPTVLLQVPVTTSGADQIGADNIQGPPGGKSRSRSRSTSVAVSERRRSPRIHSRSPTPTPSSVPAKRSADISKEEPVAKRPREE
jgi:hypothetical protein